MTHFIHIAVHEHTTWPDADEVVTRSLEVDDMIGWSVVKNVPDILCGKPA